MRSSANGPSVPRSLPGRRPRHLRANRAASAHVCGRLCSRGQTRSWVLWASPPRPFLSLHPGCYRPQLVTLWLCIIDGGGFHAVLRFRNNGAALAGVPHNVLPSSASVTLRSASARGSVSCSQRSGVARFNVSISACARNKRAGPTE
jgi:hypothetical protein